MRKLCVFIAGIFFASFLLSGQVIASADKDVNYWQGRFPNATCWAHVANEYSDHGTLSADGLYATLNPWNPKWPYLGYKAVILMHADGTFKLFDNPQPGRFAFDDNSKIAKWIVCKADQHSPYTTVTTTLPSTTTSSTVPATTTTVTVPSATTTSTSTTTTTSTTSTTVAPTTSTTIPATTLPVTVPKTTVTPTTVIVTTLTSTTVPASSTTTVDSTTTSTTQPSVVTSSTTTTVVVSTPSTTIPPNSSNPGLPKTGSSFDWILLIGLIFVTVGFTVWGWYRKNHSTR